MPETVTREDSAGVATLTMLQRGLTSASRRELLAAVQEEDGYLDSHFQVRFPGERFVQLAWRRRPSQRRGVGDPYELPNERSYCETGAAIA